MKESDIEKIQNTIANSEWRFAKTMPHMPHFYTLRKMAESDEEFVSLVNFIRSHGYDQKWGGRLFRYLDLDGWTYWTMGAKVESTILVNRARLDRAENPIQPNLIEFVQTLDWPEVYCRVKKRLVPEEDAEP